MSYSKPSTINFTDEDLKRLKEEMKDRDCVGYAKITIPIFDALLARLEAAEKVCEFMRKCEKLDNAYPDWWYLEPKLTAWRKAKGVGE